MRETKKSFTSSQKLQRKSLSPSQAEIEEYTNKILHYNVGEIL